MKNSNIFFSTLLLSLKKADLCFCFVSISLTCLWRCAALSGWFTAETDRTRTQFVVDEDGPAPSWLCTSDVRSQTGALHVYKLSLSMQKVHYSFNQFYQ